MNVATNASHIANLNPLRYRSYFYDAETGWYRLNTRYYNPVVGRFINADSYASTGQGFLGHNMFAYCLNNPVVMADANGEFAIAAVTAGALLGNLLYSTGIALVGVAGAIALVDLGIEINEYASSLTATTSKSKDAVASSTTDATTVVAPKIEEQPRNNTVYKLVDEKGKVQYVGRTRCLPAREYAHKHNPYRKDLTLQVIKSDLTYNEARGLEQIAMLVYHTINTANKMNNQINGISPNNGMINIYMEAGRGVARYIDNVISNEILYWAGF